MSGQYDPYQRIRAIMDTARRNKPVIKSSNVKGLVKEDGETPLVELHPTKDTIEGLVIPIGVLGDEEVLPDDMKAVEKSKEGLKAHVRPDGGVFLGFYGSSRDDAVVVYGSPDWDEQLVIRCVVDFWTHQLAEHIADAVIVEE